MTRSCKSQRLTLQALEDRALPSVGTFVEDFTNDYRSGRGGFDSAKDHVQISAYKNSILGASIVATPVDGPAGRHSLRLATSPFVSTAQYLGWVYHTSESGALAPWEQVTDAAVSVRGVGTVTFIGRGSYATFNTSDATTWTTYRVDANTTGNDGQPLGAIDGMYASTRGEMFLDDVTINVGMDTTHFEGDASVVRVWRFGNGLGIAGDDRDNLVRIELLYDTAGTIRVTGLAGTSIVAGSPNVTQVSPNEVLIADFARPDWEDGPRPDDRDMFINLNGGDDVLQIVGADVMIPDSTIDDLFIQTSSGDSLVEIDRLMIFDSLTFRSGSGVDNLTIAGRTRIRVLNMATGAGNDDVRIGEAGARVFDGEDAGDVYISNPDVLNPRRTRVDTGAGSDNVSIAGGHFPGMDVFLGSGVDHFRLESADWTGYINPGSNEDVIEIKDSAVFFRLALVDSHDVLRLDRVIGNQNQVIGSRITIEIPPSGTQHKFSAGDWIPAEWNTSLAADELLARVRGFFEETSRHRIASVRAALFDF